MVAKPVIPGLLYQVASRTCIRMVAARNAAEAIAKVL